jgi:hypothetical protein
MLAERNKVILTGFLKIYRVCAGSVYFQFENLPKHCTDVHGPREMLAHGTRHKIIPPGIQCSKFLGKFRVSTSGFHLWVSTFPFLTVVPLTWKLSYFKEKEK